jgi:hypothetical protein
MYYGDTDGRFEVIVEGQNNFWENELTKRVSALGDKKTSSRKVLQLWVTRKTQ